MQTEIPTRTEGGSDIDTAIARLRQKYQADAEAARLQEEEQPRPTGFSGLVERLKSFLKH